MTAETLVNRRTQSKAREENAELTRVTNKVEKERSSFDFAWVSWSKNELAGDVALGHAAVDNTEYLKRWSRVSPCLWTHSTVYSCYKNYFSLQPATRQRYSVHTTATYALISVKYQVPLPHQRCARLSHVTGTKGFSEAQSHHCQTAE